MKNQILRTIIILSLFIVMILSLTLQENIKEIYYSWQEKNSHHYWYLLFETQNTHIDFHESHILPFLREIPQKEKSIQEPIFTLWNQSYLFSFWTKPQTNTLELKQNLRYYLDNLKKNPTLPYFQYQIFNFPQNSKTSFFLPQKNYQKKIYHLLQHQTTLDETLPLMDFPLQLHIPLQHSSWKEIQELTEKIEKIKGVEQIIASHIPTPYHSIKLISKIIHQKGLRPEDITSQIQKYFETQSLSTSSFARDLNLVYTKPQSLKDLENIMILSPEGPLPLSQIAHISTSQGGYAFLSPFYQKELFEHSFLPQAPRTSFFFIKIWPHLFSQESLLELQKIIQPYQGTLTSQNISQNIPIEAYIIFIALFIFLLFWEKSYFKIDSENKIFQRILIHSSLYFIFISLFYEDLNISSLIFYLLSTISIEIISKSIHSSILLKNVILSQKKLKVLLILYFFIFFYLFYQQNQHIKSLSLFIAISIPLLSLLLSPNEPFLLHDKPYVRLKYSLPFFLLTFLSLGILLYKPLSFSYEYFEWTPATSQNTPLLYKPFITLEEKKNTPHQNLWGIYEIQQSLQRHLIDPQVHFEGHLPLPLVLETDLMNLPLPSLKQELSLLQWTNSESKTFSLEERLQINFKPLKTRDIYNNIESISLHKNKSYFSQSKENISEIYDIIKRQITIMLILSFFSSWFFQSSVRILISSLIYLIINISFSLGLIFIQPNLILESLLDAEWLTLLSFLLWMILLYNCDIRRSSNLIGARSLRLSFMCWNLALKLWGLGSILTLLVLGKDPTFIKPLAIFLLWTLWLGLGNTWSIMMIYHSLEHTQRLLLRWLIRLSVILLGILLTSPVKANSPCQSQLSLILPLLGRPKGQEPPLKKAVLAERLAQELQCAFTMPQFEKEMNDIISRNRKTTNQSLIIEEMRTFVHEHYAEIEEEYHKQLQGVNNPSQATLFIYGGYFEEFYGNTALTLLRFSPTQNIWKITVSEEQETESVALLAEHILGGSRKWVETFVGSTEKLPVYLYPVVSLDEDPLSENISDETDLFIRSRLKEPISFKFFDRRTFFELTPRKEEALYSIDIKLRRERTRVYASLTLQHQNGNRSTAWNETDLTRWALFQEELLSNIHLKLLELEGINDYSITIGPEIKVDWDQKISQLTHVNFRQNYGNASLNVRFRSGRIKKEDQENKQEENSLLGLGAGFAWQYLDFKKWNLDFGVSFDIGLLSSEKIREYFFSYGVFSQILYRYQYVSLLGKLDLEQPQVLADLEDREKTLSLFYLSLSFGIGISF